MSIVCSECQAEVADHAAFCQQCGTKLAGAAQADQSLAPKQRFEAAAAATRSTDDPPENELWQGQYSKLAMIGSWIGAGVVSLLLIVVALSMSFSSTGWSITVAAIVLLWIGLVCRLFYRQLSERYYLTDQRFIHESGILWREINRIEAIDVDDVSFQQGPIERLFGVGTITITSSDRSHPKLDLPGIEKVHMVAEMIDEVRRQERRKRGLYVEAV
ncbi:MAG: PH domain-containing protein [Planctomycetes bacterium]|nr:PH domain-containing protein [Planctomycetota bacterium]